MVGPAPFRRSRGRSWRRLWQATAGLAEALPWQALAEVCRAVQGLHALAGSDRLWRSGKLWQALGRLWQVWQALGLWQAGRLWWQAVADQSSNRSRSRALCPACKVHEAYSLINTITPLNPTKNRVTVRNTTGPPEAGFSEPARACQSLPEPARACQSLRKVFSPIIGYGHDFELLQFVYDLTMWSRIGGGKNACAGLPLRLVLKGETFSPLYWKSKHQALIDMQRQCGYPSLFKTMASWEYSFPYHLFVLDEMEKGGRGRMQLAGLETLHTAHVFTQLNRGLYSGRNKTSAQDGWKDHILSADSVPEERRPQTVVNCLEFQHEKRKLPTQDYHGSGRVHSLDYVENVDQVGLERKLAATVPDAEDQPALQGTWKADRTVAATVAGRWRTASPGGTLIKTTSRGFTTQRRTRRRGTELSSRRHWR